jgi:hypothetical protein
MRRKEGIKKENIKTDRKIKLKKYTKMEKERTK